MKHPGQVLTGLEAYLWRRQPESQATWKVRAMRVARTAVVLGRDIAAGQLTLRAMSLVYTTLLSIVPLLALSFSVLKAFGVSNQIRPALLGFLAPLGEKGAEVANRIVEFIERMNVGVLGAVGLGALLYTAISLVQKIEESLNFIWHTRHSRPLGERFTRYLSVLMVGPLLIFAAVGITASVANIDTVRSLLSIALLGHAVEVLGRLMPYLLVISAFTFIYLFIPNARVRPGPALVGGVIAGVAWQTAGWAFALFVVGSNNYSAIYSGLAILVLFMIWVYVSWLILLFGASVGFYVQHPEYLFGSGGEPRLSNRMRERLALSVASHIASRFLTGERPPSVEDFSRAFCVPAHVLQTVLDSLQSGTLVARTASEPAAYVPARDPSDMTVRQVLEAVRVLGEDRFLSPEAVPVTANVEALIARMSQAVDASVGGTTLRELAQGGVATLPPLRVLAPLSDPEATATR